MSAMRLSLRADWRSLNIPWRSSTRFFAFALNSRCDPDLQFFPIAPFCPRDLIDSSHLMKHGSRGRQSTEIRGRSDSSKEERKNRIEERREALELELGRVWERETVRERQQRNQQCVTAASYFRSRRLFGRQNRVLSFPHPSAILDDDEDEEGKGEPPKRLMTRQKRRRNLFIPLLIIFMWGILPATLFLPTRRIYPPPYLSSSSTT